MGKNESSRQHYQPLSLLIIMSAIVSTHFNSEQLALIKSHLMVSGKDGPVPSDNDIRLFGMVCAQLGLDPFAKQIFAIQRKGKWTFQPSVDGLRAIASRTGDYAGSDEPLFDEGLSTYQFEVSGRAVPVVCTVKVYRMIQGQRCPFVGVAPYSEFVQSFNGKPSDTWAKMPLSMLAKCFSSDTEVLTTKGFERFSDVKGNILQVTNQGLQAVDSKPFSQPYFGEMIQADGDTLNFSVTPNHDMVTTFGKVEASAMYETTRSRPMWKIPMCINGSDIDYPVSDELLLLAGYVLADGTHSGYHQWRIAVSRPYKIAELQKLGPSKQSIQRSSGAEVSLETRIIKTNFDKVIFAFDDNHVSSLISPNKLVNIEIVLQLSKRQARLMLDAWQMFDGYTNKKTGVRRIYTSNPDHVKAIEVLSVCAGYAVNNPTSRTNDISSKPNYYLTISELLPSSVVKESDHRPGLSIKPNQSGHVWCVTVPSGKIVVRRNGFSMICGNCAESQALRKAFPQCQAVEQTIQSIEDDSWRIDGYDWGVSQGVSPSIAHEIMLVATSKENLFRRLQAAIPVKAAVVSEV